MVVTVEARKFNLPHLSLSSPQVTSLLYEPNSLSLALMHSDSSFSLFPSFSPFSISSCFSSSLPTTQTLISAPSSSACFVPLNPNSKIPDCPDHKKVVFVTAGPHNGGSRVLLRFHVLGKDGKFVKTHMVCTQNGVSFDRKLGVIVDVSHGMKVLLAGSVNYFAMYSASASKIWVFGLNLGKDESGLRLVKCAVIDCHLPVSSICISFGYLILGELHGVRVFPLRALVKGSVGSRRRSRAARGRIESLKGEQQEVNVKVESRNSKLPNGVIRPVGESFELDKNLVNLNPSKSKVMANGYAYNVLGGVPSNSSVDGNRDSVKLRSLKLRQDSGGVGMQFVLFNDSVVEEMKSRVPRYKTTKAVSIHALSQQKFLVLNSSGNLHVLHLSKSGSPLMRHLTGIIQAQQLAAFPDTSANSQSVWLSDGLNSVHKLVISGTDETGNEIDLGSCEGKINHSSVTEAIFASESILDMIPLAANTVLLLGQGKICVAGQSIKYFENQFKLAVQVPTDSTGREITELMSYSSCLTFMRGSELGALSGNLIDGLLDAPKWSHSKSHSRLGSSSKSNVSLLMASLSWHAKLVRAGNHRLMVI